jgi:tetratricopeptide (TPR) repeat protein
MNIYDDGWVLGVEQVDVKQSLPRFEQYYASGDRAAHFLREYAKLLRLEEHYERAFEVLEEGLELHHGERALPLLDERVEIFKRLGRPLEALKDLKKLAHLAQRPASRRQRWLQLSSAYIGLGDLDAAQDVIHKEILEENLQDSAVCSECRRLAWAYLERGNKDVARKIVERIFEAMLGQNPQEDLELYVSLHDRFRKLRQRLGLPTEKFEVVRDEVSGWEPWTNSSSPTIEQRRKRGRPRDTDEDEDRRISEAWETGSYRTYDELAQAKKIPEREVRRALDRHRKRVERPGE